MRHLRRRGFTLIELLVVIAIIAILAAILFPVLLHTRSRAYTATCASNLKQMGLVFAMYRDDYGGYNPYIWQGGVDDVGCFFWLMTKYAKTKIGPQANNIFKDPAAPWLKQEYDPANGGNVPGKRSHQCFAYQVNETGWTDVKWGGQFFSDGHTTDSRVRRPKELIVVGDALGWVSYGIAYGDGAPHDNEELTATQSGVRGNSHGWVGVNPPLDEVIPLSNGSYGRWGGSVSKVYNIRVNHGGAANLLFYDGHVRTLRVTYGRNWVVAY